MEAEARGLLQALEKQLADVVKEVYICREMVDEITYTIQELDKEIKSPDARPKGMDMSLLRPCVEGAQ